MRNHSLVFDFKRVHPMLLDSPQTSNLSFKYSLSQAYRMAEAVSLVLAVAPLIVSAGEHFSSTAEALSRYKRFSDEVDDFFAELNVQCAIFRAAVQLLLASFVGDEQAAQMLLNGQHGGWKDPSLEFYLEERFSICSSAFMDSLVLLRNRLVSLQKLSESFQHVVEDVNSVSPYYLCKWTRIAYFGRTILYH